MALKTMPDYAYQPRPKAAIHGITGANRGHALFRERNDGKGSGTMDGDAVGNIAELNQPVPGITHRTTSEYTTRVAARQDISRIPTAPASFRS